jgi:PST family polysaccharide transporter
MLPGHVRETFRHVVSNRDAVEGFFDLFLVKLIDLLIFLVITPFLISRLGIELYGVVNVAQAAFAFFIVAADYGFNITAVRFVSLNRHDEGALRIYIGRVLAVKSTLVAGGAMVLVVLTATANPFADHRGLYWLGYLCVIGQTLQPVWFFQGLEKMRRLAMLNLATKTVYFLGVMALIRGADDYTLVLFLFGLANLVVAAWTWGLIFRRYGVSWDMAGLGDWARRTLREDFGVVSSNFSIAVYTSANLIILDRFAEKYVVGYYSLVEKIVQLVLVVLTVFSTVIYPRLCRLTADGYDAMKRWLDLTFRAFAAGMCGALVLMAVFRAPILGFFARGQILGDEAYTVFLVMLLAPLVVMLNIPAYQTLLAYNEKGAYSVILISGAVVSVCLALTLVPLFSVWGMVATVISTAAYTTAGLHYMARVKVARRFAAVKGA